MSAAATSPFRSLTPTSQHCRHGRHRRACNVAGRLAAPAPALSLPAADGRPADAAYHAGRSAGKIGSSPMHVKRADADTAGGHVLLLLLPPLHSFLLSYLLIDFCPLRHSRHQFCETFQPQTLHKRRDSRIFYAKKNWKALRELKPPPS